MLNTNQKRNQRCLAGEEGIGVEGGPFILPLVGEGTLREKLYNSW